MDKINRNELIEKMCEADCNAITGHYPRQTSWSGMRDFEREDWRKGMSAALDVAREVLLKDVDDDETVGTWFRQGMLHSAEMKRLLQGFIEYRRAALEAKTPEQQVAGYVEALIKIADHGTQLPWSECARIAREAIVQGSSEPWKGLRPIIAMLANKTEGEARALVEAISCRLGFGHAVDMERK